MEERGLVWVAPLGVVCSFVRLFVCLFVCLFIVTLFVVLFVVCWIRIASTFLHCASIKCRDSVLLQYCGCKLTFAWCGPSTHASTEWQAHGVLMRVGVCGRVCVCVCVCVCLFVFVLILMKPCVILFLRFLRNSVSAIHVIYRLGFHAKFNQ